MERVLSPEMRHVEGKRENKCHAMQQCEGNRNALSHAQINQILPHRRIHGMPCGEEEQRAVAGYRHGEGEVGRGIEGRRGGREEGEGEEGGRGRGMSELE